ncbi:Uma2 family endonuclease [Chloroflexus sp.]|uniref:Uma2 family endonuclease n=1 Tax=Chloroflexus sp. TaxID=1904827 RepID=UPI002ACD8979|nr:Uma2 family endonuclease [Chloroflexus sp.]
MPSDRHQVISQTLFLALHAYIRIVLYAPLRLRLRDGTFREPDLVLVQRRDDPRRQPHYWVGADLVVEIVNPDDPECDTVVKRADYAETGIPEYWIVEPDAERVMVLALRDGRYHEAGVYPQSEPVRSVLLPELAIPLQAILAEP